MRQQLGQHVKLIPKTVMENSRSCLDVATSAASGDRYTLQAVGAKCCGTDGAHIAAGHFVYSLEHERLHQCAFCDDADRQPLAYQLSDEYEGPSDALVQQ